MRKKFGGCGRDQAHGELGTGRWPSARESGSRARGMLGTGWRRRETSDRGAERGAGRPGNRGKGRSRLAREPNGSRRCAGAHAGEAPPCVSLNEAPPRTPPIGTRAAAPWRPFVGADWSRRPTEWRACLAAQVSERVVCSFEPLRPGRRARRAPPGRSSGGRVPGPPAPAALWRSRRGGVLSDRHTESRSGGSEPALPPSAHALLLPPSLLPEPFPLLSAFSFPFCPSSFGSAAVCPPVRGRRCCVFPFRAARGLQFWDTGLSLASSSAEPCASACWPGTDSKRAGRAPCSRLLGEC